MQKSCVLSTDGPLQAIGAEAASDQYTLADVFFLFIS